MKNEDILDGEIFIQDNHPPLPVSRQERSSDENLWYERVPYQTTDTSDISTLYERVLFRTKDPTTLPHSRSKCVKWARIGSIKTCIGWKVQWQWMFVTAELRVTTSVPTDVGGLVEDCLKEAAVIAALSVVISGGSAAIAAAEAAFKACLVRKLGEELLNVNIVLHHVWGNWE